MKNFSNYKDYSLKEDLHFESKAVHGALGTEPLTVEIALVGLDKRAIDIAKEEVDPLEVATKAVEKAGIDLAGADLAMMIVA